MKRTKALVVLAGLLLFVGLGVYVSKLIHETVQSRIPGRQYIVSLGDSVAAGAGLTDTGGRKPSDCDLAGNAFPLLLGQQLHKPVVQFACSNATVATGQNANTLLGTQYDAAQPYIHGSDVVVYAGANDIGWLQTLMSCVNANCATRQHTDEFKAKLRVLQGNMTTLLKQVQQMHPRRLVVNTYYSLLAPDDTCFARIGITPQKVAFINDAEAELNATIAAAATRAKAMVVHVDFSGHSLCGAEPWIQGVSARAPLHPTAAGQQQIARQDAQVLR